MEVYEGAKVSAHVTSQTSNFPLFHGTMDMPSGRLPSNRYIPEGSSLEGTFAADKVRKKSRSGLSGDDGGPHSSGN